MSEMSAPINNVDVEVKKEKARGEIARISKNVLRSVKRFNEIKSHEYYQTIDIVFKVSKRTKSEVFRCIVARIPQTKIPERSEYIILAFYLSNERVVQKQHFIRRYEYVMRELKKLMNNHSEYHIFIYFIAYGFRYGVYEEVRAIRGRFKELGSNITLKLIELRYNDNIREEVFKDLLNYLGSRVSGILKSDFERSNNMVFSRLKHFLDYCFLILTYVNDNEDLKDLVEDLAYKTEVSVREYKKIANALSI